MNFEEYGDVKLNDDFVSNGGCFKDMKINGDCNIRGDFKCRSFSVNGDVNADGAAYCEEAMGVRGDFYVGGSLEADEVKISGDVEITGDVKVNKELKVNGDMESGGSIQCGSISVSGDMKCSSEVSASGNISISGDAEFMKNICGDEIKIRGDIKRCSKVKAKIFTISGEIKSAKSIEADKIGIMGGVTCNGLINGDDVLICPMDKSYADEIGGKRIRILNSSSMKGFGLFLNLYNSTRGGGMNCNSVEGDDIEIENTSCRVVRGKNIIIGKGCVVDRVEYYDTLEVNENASVKDRVKL